MSTDENAPRVEPLALFSCDKNEQVSDVASCPCYFWGVQPSQTTALRPKAATWALALICCTTLACGTDPETQSVRVDLRTDFVSGVEFDSLRVQFGDGDLAESQDRINREADDFLRGQRVASAQVPTGQLPIIITLYRSSRPVIARRVSAQVGPGLNIAPVVITRTCEGVECPNDDPALESCLGGRCVDPRCSSMTPEFCPPAQCTDDSECESVACAMPRCADEVCFSIPDDTRCAAGERCDGILGCVPSGVFRDAGIDAPSLDGGPDATAMVDAGVDSRLPDVSVPDVPAPDVFDAGPATGEFGTPRLLSELTTGMTEADDPTLTQDFLQIFFKTTRPLARMWTARRSALGQPFGALAQVDAILPGDVVTSPELRQDGLVLFFVGLTAGDFNFYRATRPNLGATFSRGVLISEINTGAWEFAFGTNASETLAIFTRSVLRETRRASTSVAWGTPTVITALNQSGTEIDSHIIDDGRVLYYAGDDPSNAGLSLEIWRAERPNLETPFGTPLRIESVSSTADDTDPWVSADERVIVFMSRRSGREELYVATRDGGSF